MAIADSKAARLEFRFAVKVSLWTQEGLFSGGLLQNPDNAGQAHAGFGSDGA
jgi:hypothetical protein